MKTLTRTTAAVLERVVRPLEQRGLRRPKNLLVLAYHRIDETGSHLSVRRDHFRAHLDCIEARGARLVSLDDVDLQSRDDAPRVALTFDDGYRSVASVWPELKSRRWPATAYVVAGYLAGDRTFPWDGASDESARLMDESLLRQLADDGMAVGSHTVTHPYLPPLTLGEARAEISDSKKMLEDLLGRSVTSFSYPMGGWNRSLRDTVAEAGYRTAVTVLERIEPPGPGPPGAAQTGGRKRSRRLRPDHQGLLRLPPSDRLVA